MPDDIVITEKTSQAKDVRAAVGARFGPVLPAEGHLLALLEPEEVVPAWKRWAPVLLRPDGLYGTKPATGGNKASKLKAIRDALKGAKRVWLATDCDREGQLIGQEILEHCRYRGEVRRVMFTAQDPQTIREAFAAAKPNSEYARLYGAAVARQQADQIYNLSLTRTATVTLGRGGRAVVGVGRVKTPTLAIVCRRELEIRAFKPQAYFEVVATAQVAVRPLRDAARAQGQDPGARARGSDRGAGGRLRGPARRQGGGEAAGAAAAARPALLAEALRIALRLVGGEDARGGAGALRRRGQEGHHLPPRRDPLPAREPRPGHPPDRGRAAGRPDLPRGPGAGRSPSSAAARAGTSGTRGWRARRTTPSSPTRTRWATCPGSGRACRRTSGGSSC